MIGSAFRRGILVSLASAIVLCAPTTLPGAASEPWRVTVVEVNGSGTRYCARANLQLQLQDAGGVLMASCDLPLGQRTSESPHAWELAIPRGGLYTLVAVVTDCDGAARREVMEIHVDDPPMSRIVDLIVQGSQNGFTLLHLESCSDGRADGYSELAWEDGLLVTNRSGRTLSVCGRDSRSDVEAQAYVDGFWETVARWKWPDDVREVNPDRRVFLGKPVMTPLHVDPDWVASEMRLIMRFSSRGSAHLDLGWGSLEPKPFGLHACCDTWHVEITDKALVGKLVKRQEDPMATVHRRIAKTREAIVSAARGVENYAAARRNEKPWYPRSYDRIVEIDSLVGEIGPALAGCARDEWGGPLWYWSDGLDYLIASSGADGKSDRPYQELLTTAGSPVEFLENVCGGQIDSLGADLVWVDGESCQWPRAGWQGVLTGPQDSRP